MEIRRWAQSPSWEIHRVHTVSILEKIWQCFIWAALHKKCYFSKNTYNDFSWNHLHLNTWEHFTYRDFLYPIRYARCFDMAVQWIPAHYMLIISMHNHSELVRPLMTKATKEHYLQCLFLACGHVRVRYIHSHSSRPRVQVVSYD